ncbi:hypothetical protein DL766_009354 [Monosporascus sp. MC13-8B]|uniref:Thiamine pyrophosphate enzyme N-terminal TPP-binding domain-containing protein n=1 Tax=Monosporascus cannonballus TaxID=155416 RepID=A0ABY0HKF8_9PEZI|nr:hypothetical protein DL763_009021 [Monosporascus cannonballus]RYO92612.1 hypothetical protein DL762_001515 [Monosporascus cannonballus]RYP15642.1 hypothetical protein DL766_009354 [Monosporascus sp. MC13-8B]
MKRVHLEGGGFFLVDSQTPTGLHIFTSPTETNTLSAASGFAQVMGAPGGRPRQRGMRQAGTGPGAILNVAKGCTPVMILAGAVPVTVYGELHGNRNEYIHRAQDVPDQRAIVRQYRRYEHEIRRPQNAAQRVPRSLQFATNSLRGPAYLIASRERLRRNLRLREATADLRLVGLHESTRA